MEANSEPSRTYPQRVRELPWFALSVLICLGLLACRRPDAFTAPWFYAEEGRDFFADAYRDGWTSLSGTVNGYFHLYPRIVANIGLSLGLPIAQMPWFNSAGVLAMYGVVWGYAFLRSPGTVVWRCIAVLCTVLPPLGNEVWMNMTNVQWPMALLIPLILFGRETDSPMWRGLDALLLGLACSTGPFALVFSPVVVHAWWKTPARDRGLALHIRTAIVTVAALVQAAALFAHGNIERTTGAFDPLDAGFVQAVFQQVWYPVLGTGVRFVPFLGQVTLTIAGLGLLYLALRKVPVARPFIGCAIALVLVTLYSYRGEPGFLSPYDAGIRNFYLPTVLIAWSLVLAAPQQKGRPLLIAVLVSCWWVMQLLLFIGPKTYARPGIVIDEAALARGGTLVVPIDPPGWTMVLGRVGPRRRGGSHDEGLSDVCCRLSGCAVIAAEHLRQHLRP